MGKLKTYKDYADNDYDYTESYIKTVSSNVEILKSYADESDD